ncbi:MarR family winged helix-turn-helix transcriptional regulator [Azospirillum sp. ST 5-10]|uniref:MarR family winged helix-turn-helix transcriptional regulator n=1 Tax=unclassified Azospirillum TaxID=2630922 RepID=UPI003F4A7997
MQEPTSVTDLLTTRLLLLSNTLALYSSRYYRQQFGVTLPEWRVMSIIASRDGTTARDISRALATDKAWVGLSVKSLAERGLLTRSSDTQDSRRVLLSLTTRGRDLHDAIMAVAQRRQRRLLATLPDGAADVLSLSLDRLQAEADRMLAELDPSAPDDAP